MSEVLQGRALWVVAACWFLAAASAPARTVHAQSAALGTDGLRGGRHVGSALTDDVRFRGVGSLGYAHTGDVLENDDRHERVFATLSAGLVAKPWMQLALRLDGRYDTHRGSAGSDSGLAGSTELTSRHAWAVRRDLALAAQARVRFPAASSARRGFSAATTELSAIASRALWGTGEISGTLGYRFDRSERALASDDTLSAADRWAAQTSRYNAALLGALLAAPVGAFTVIGEWSWDMYVGSGAPGPLSSPMRLRGALQTEIGRYLVPSVELGIDMTRRPTFQEGVRIEPRFWAAVNLGIVLRPRPTQQAPMPEEQAPTAVVEPEQRAGVLFVQVTEAGKVMPGASVTLTTETATLTETSDSEGRARFEVERGTELNVSVNADGCHTATQSLSLDEPELVLAIALERVLPEGEIKGRVRSLRGGPLKAQIEILDTGKVVQSQADGTFSIDVPPGDYRVRITAEGHEPQERTAQVERLGVTILVVDLRRTRK